jgi:hypothetical protein
MMNRQRNAGESEQLTLGQAFAAKVRLMVWCKLCARRTEPDVAQLVSCPPQHG